MEHGEKPIPDIVVRFNEGARDLFEETFDLDDEGLYSVYITGLAHGIRFTREYPTLAIALIKSGFYGDSPPVEQDLLAAYTKLKPPKLSVEQLIDEGNTWYNELLTLRGILTPKPVRVNPFYDPKKGNLWAPIVGDDELHFGWADKFLQ